MASSPIVENPEESRSFFLALPDKILLQMASYLPPGPEYGGSVTESLCEFSLVCKRFVRVAQESLIQLPCFSKDETSCHRQIVYLVHHLVQHMNLGRKIRCIEMPTDTTYYDIHHMLSIPSNIYTDVAVGSFVSVLNITVRIGQKWKQCLERGPCPAHVGLLLALVPNLSKLSIHFKMILEIRWMLGNDTLSPFPAFHRLQCLTLLNSLFPLFSFKLPSLRILELELLQGHIFDPDEASRIEDNSFFTVSELYLKIHISSLENFGMGILSFYPNFKRLLLSFHSLSVLRISFLSPDDHGKEYLAQCIYPDLRTASYHGMHVRRRAGDDASYWTFKHLIEYLTPLYSTLDRFEMDTMCSGSIFEPIATLECFRKLRSLVLPSDALVCRLDRHDDWGECDLCPQARLPQSLEYLKILYVIDCDCYTAMYLEYLILCTDQYPRLKCIELVFQTTHMIEEFETTRLTEKLREAGFEVRLRSDDTLRQIFNII